MLGFRVYQAGWFIIHKRDYNRNRIRTIIPSSSSWSNSSCPTSFPPSTPWLPINLSLLRDKNTEPKKFRELIREIATLLTYEATSDLILYQINIDTPLATTTGNVLSEKICLVPILRAGLGMVEGVWHLMPIRRGVAYWSISG